MPSKSQAQHNLMEAAAHGAKWPKAAKIGEKVGREFVSADKARGKKAEKELPKHKGKKGK